jgi:hypothetical protein
VPERLAIIMDRSARYFFERVATHDEQRRIGEIVTGICENPYVDDEVKFPFSYPPVDALLFADGEYWVVYQITGPGEITVLNIGFEEDPPRPESSDI